jgi:hypothetical protein
MNAMKKVVAGAVLSLGFLFSTAARAMPIPQFDKLTHKQQGAYDFFLIDSAANILADQGDTAGAAKVRDLLEIKPGQPVKPAMIQLVENTNAMRAYNQQHANDPGFKPFEVEHALSLVLKNNGIFLPPSKLLQVSQNWKPADAAGSVTAQNAVPALPGPHGP